MRKPSWLATVVAVCLASICWAAGHAIADAAPTKADVQAQLKRGHEIAVARCSVCHAIGLDDPSPTRINANTAFRQLSDRFPISMLREAARTGYVSGHDEMPGFQFSLADIRALLTYIDSMAPASARYIGR
jgi:cytochrome c